MRLNFRYIGIVPYWKWALLISAIVLVAGYKEKGWNNNYIHSDGLGYYSYLPAIFIYKDLSFNFIEKYEKEHYLPGQHYDFRQDVAQGRVNRYYAGTALLQLPFFLVTNAACMVLDQDTCGYSHPYQYTVLAAACFYLFIGLWMLMKILSFYIKKWLAILIPTLLLFSTPLLFYTIYNPDFSHIYSFAIINLFIYFSIIYFQYPAKNKLIILFIWLGLIALIRPINILVILLLPFFAGDWKVFTKGLLFALKNHLVLSLGLILFLSITSLQLILYYLQTGSFFVYSYGPYGFNFLNSHFIDILFSYRKGLFIYSPVLFFSLLGFCYLLRKSFYEGVYLLCYLILLIYILSSWDFWTYGMTYGQRPFIEHYFIFAIPLGLMVHRVRKKLKIITIGLLIIFCIHNLIQISQHRHYILHWDNMDKEKYWKVFLRTDPIYYGITWTPVIPIMDDTTGFLPLNISDTLTRKVIKLKTNELFTRVYFIHSNQDSLDIVVSLAVFPESKKIKKNQIRITVNDVLFEINMRNLEPLKWNLVNKKMKLPNSTKGIVNIKTSNNGNYNFNIKSIRILHKNDANK